MRNNLLICLPVLAIVVALIYGSRKCSVLCSNGSDRFTHKDKQRAEQVLQDLEDQLARDTVPSVTTDALALMENEILLVKLPSEDTKEKLSFFPAENTRQWPSQYSSFPYNYKYGGAWPPGMYSKLHHWSPGFYTTGSGWSYYMRPGMGYKSWPRNRWIRNTRNGKESYYYVTNRGNYTHGAADYSGLPLDFPS